MELPARDDHAQGHHSPGGGLHRGVEAIGGHPPHCPGAVRGEGIAGLAQSYKQLSREWLISYPSLSITHRFFLIRIFQTSERSLLVRWVVGSILHGVDPLSYFLFQPVLHDWCNKGRGMCYPVCGMVHIKELLLLIDKSSLCGGSGFPFSLSEWSLTICLTP